MATSAPQTILHGVFMEIIRTGVLIRGESGLGKSELALELVSRGHRLIADDTPEFKRIAPATINGTCPELLQNFLEVRELGILDIRRMYGENAVKSNKNLELIIEMLPAETSTTKDRARPTEKKTNVLGINIPTVSMSVSTGRNLAVLVEAAVRNHLLVGNGYDGSKHFIERQKIAIHTA